MLDPESEELEQESVEEDLQELHVREAFQFRIVLTVE